ncbi:MAG: LON peptidase substrate-binding domain-containing protein [Planctomycetales bacterium]|nr:LON peptidase substrate-binding domain-containing protein [Planctomycetales bacterium]
MDDAALPTRIPLFPLPSVVLLPTAVIPLHIFEPRYRLMVRRCLDGTGVFGMVLTRDGGPEADATERPLHEVGAAGRIVDHEPVGPARDGRMNILVRGERRFRIRAVDRAEPYLVAEVSYLAAPPAPAAREAEGRERLGKLFREFLAHCVGDTEAALDRLGTLTELGDAVDFCASLLDLSLRRRQAILETLDTGERLESLVSEIEARMRAIRLKALEKRFPKAGFSAN